MVQILSVPQELKKAIKNTDQNTVNKHLIAKGIKWKFNAPVSPWMGGIWESLVKSVKRSLQVIIRNKLFTEECLPAFLCEVESILNQRPLSPISDDVNDLKALTPSHFIIGTYENTVPGVFHKQVIDYCQKWRSVQAAVDVFWNRWKKEYLPSLNLRKRWTQNNRNFRVGDLVIISSHDVPQSYWPMGRIIEVYPGQDCVVRSIKLKTSNGELSWPNALLCLLEAAD